MVEFVRVRVKGLGFAGHMGNMVEYAWVRFNQGFRLPGPHGHPIFCVVISISMTSSLRQYRAKVDGLFQCRTERLVARRTVMVLLGTGSLGSRV